jgi:hypothetical protein
MFVRLALLVGLFLTVIQVTPIEMENNDLFKLLPNCSGVQCDCNSVCDPCHNPCQPTCDNPKPNCSFIITVCIPACVCKDGFILDKEGGKCIPCKECKKLNPCGTCPSNTVYDRCPKKCQPTCSNPNCNPCELTSPCTPGCVCSSGYILNATGGSCIPIYECPMPSK